MINFKSYSKIEQDFMTKALLCIKMLYKNISRSNRKIVLEDEIDSYKKFYTTILFPVFCK